MGLLWPMEKIMEFSRASLERGGEGALQRPKCLLKENGNCCLDMGIMGTNM